MPYDSRRAHVFDIIREKTPKRRLAATMLLFYLRYVLSYTYVVLIVFM